MACTSPPNPKLLHPPPKAEQPLRFRVYGFKLPPSIVCPFPPQEANLSGSTLGSCCCTVGALIIRILFLFFWGYCSIISRDHTGILLVIISTPILRTQGLQGNDLGNCLPAFAPLLAPKPRPQVLSTNHPEPELFKA